MTLAVAWLKTNCPVAVALTATANVVCSVPASAKATLVVGAGRPGWLILVPLLGGSTLIVALFTLIAATVSPLVLLAMPVDSAVTWLNVGRVPVEAETCSLTANPAADPEADVVLL